MLSPGAVMFVGATVGVFGITRSDPVLFWLGLVLVIAGGVMAWRGRR